SVAAQSPITLVRACLVVQNVLGHGAVGTHKVDCLTVPCVAAPGRSSLRALAISAGVQIEWQVSAFGSTQAAKARSIAERARHPAGTGQVRVVQEVAGPCPATVCCLVAEPGTDRSLDRTGAPREQRTQVAAQVARDAKCRGM